jgi:hypothetical protein
MNTVVTTTLTVTEYVRFFEPGGSTGPVIPTNGRTIQELADLTVRSIAIALQTYKVIEGDVALDGREKPIRVESWEFDHSPKYYFDAEVFPFAEAKEHYIWLSATVAHPEWGIRNCFDNWDFERERPEVIKRNTADSAEGG